MCGVIRDCRPVPRTAPTSRSCLPLEVVRLGAPRSPLIGEGEQGASTTRPILRIRHRTDPLIPAARHVSGAEAQHVRGAAGLRFVEAARRSGLPGGNRYRPERECPTRAERDALCHLLFRRDDATVLIRLLCTFNAPPELRFEPVPNGTSLQLSRLTERRCESHVDTRETTCIGHWLPASSFDAAPLGTGARRT